MRAKIFSRVLFPAPLRPMRPTTSPWRTSKLTSFIAQMKRELPFAAAAMLSPKAALISPMADPALGGLFKARRGPARNRSGARKASPSRLRNAVWRRPSPRR